MAKKDEEFKYEYEIVEHLCDLGDANEKGWKKELNIVKWNGGEERYDIRSWNADHTKMGKGISLSWDEACLMANEMIERGMC